MNELRRALLELPPTDADFDALVMDHFQDVHREFSAGMTRTAKINLVLDKVSRAVIMAALRTHFGYSGREFPDALSDWPDEAHPSDTDEEGENEAAIAELRKKSHAKIAAALGGAEWICHRLCSRFGLSPTTTPSALADECQAREPIQLLEAVRAAKRKMPSSGGLALRRFVSALLPEVVGSRLQAARIMEHCRSASAVLVGQGYGYAMAECLAAALHGAEGEFVRVGERLDSIHRVDLKVSTYSGAAAAKDVAAAAREFYVEFGKTFADADPDDDRLIREVAKLEAEDRVYEGCRKLMVVFREKDIDVSFAVAFKQQLLDEGLDIDVVSLRAARADDLKKIEAHIIRTISPLFDEAP